ncbi:MAG TPA: transglutaminase, partial [Terriglobales bacterium]|nr:transglutaminase [Terriglobales bacterium]
GSLLLLRPRVLGQKADDFFEGKERKYPVEFAAPTLQTDDFEITLPPGFTVDDLPTPADLDAGFASYKSQIQVQGNVLHYSRQYEIKDILVPTEQLPKLKTFYRRVAGDENASAVLKRAN